MHSYGYDLIIVESPHKAETIRSFLGQQYKTIATKGHLRDLPKERYAIEKKGNSYVAEETYITKEKSEIVKKISELAKNATNIYVATDADREGEKISKDIVELAKLSRYHRVVFREITKEHILEAINKENSDSGGLVTESIVEAQKARRFIDRFGYKLSNIINYSFKQNGVQPERSIGIGRVICPALKLIVDNTRSRDKFVPENYKQIICDLKTSDGEEFYLTCERRFFAEQKRELDDTLAALKANAPICNKIERRTEEKEPPPPLDTAALIRAAYYDDDMRYLPTQTMALAQELYYAGLITYHRTESAKLAESAIYSIIKALLDAGIEDKNISEGGRRYENNENPDAHEAIRPCFFTKDYFPKEIVKRYTNLTQEHHRLYRIIFYRTIITQMASAYFTTIKCEVVAGSVHLKGRGVYPSLDLNGEEQLGWIGMWRKFIKDSDEASNIEERYIPPLFIGQELIIKDARTYDTKTHKPDRYGFGRFITTLQNLGIGRPSTFAKIPETLIEKGFVKGHDGYLEATNLGKDVIAWCESYACANWLISIPHAAEFEIKLDSIEKGDMTADELIAEYDQLLEELKRETGYSDEKKVTEAMANKIEEIAAAKGIALSEDIFSNYEKASMFLKSHIENTQYETFGKCPSCKKSILLKTSKKGDNYFGCANKDCDFFLMDSGIERFLGNFQRDSDESERKTIIAGILSQGKKGYEIDGLVKGDRRFAASVIIEKSQNYGWQISFKK